MRENEDLVSKALDEVNLEKSKLRTLVGLYEKKLDELGKAYMTLETTKDKLMQSEKMETVGRLVSGVAHEINNPLTAVIGYSQLMLAGELPENIRQQLNIVFKEADRCKRIVQDMMTFARAQKPKMIRINPASVLIESANAFNKEIEVRKIVTDFSFQGKEVVLIADPQQLNQVFMNIIRNACVALSEVKGERHLEIKSRVSEGSFEVAIGDNGVGIAPENLNRVFDPFFTTRDVGQGTGLGLSIAYGIIQEHRGTIEVASCPEDGTYFKIKLPLREVSNSASGETGKSPEGIASSTAKPQKRRLNLLVIEDEPIILGFMKMVLETVGHKIESAKDGAEALERLKSKQYDLAVCDFRLPKMDGRELYTTIQRQVPAYKDKFIFATGSVRISDLDDTFFKQMGIPVLSKPFTAKELIDAVDSKAGKLYP